MKYTVKIVYTIHLEMDEEPDKETLKENIIIDECPFDVSYQDFQIEVEENETNS